MGDKSKNFMQSVFSNPANLITSCKILRNPANLIISCRILCSPANLITSCRILCSLVLLFFSTFSAGFYVVYLIAGFTDMLDGTVARKTGTVSEVGSKLDTIADFIFFALCLFKFAPVLELEIWMWIWLLVIAGIKAFNVVWGFVREGKLVAHHSFLNKLTGLLLFALPLTLPVVDMKYSSVLVCLVATVASVEEGRRRMM